jgi:hypothetical protein
LGDIFCKKVLTGWELIAAGFEINSERADPKQDQRHAGSAVNGQNAS